MTEPKKPAQTTVHGRGSIRQRGNVWYIRYSVDGKQHEESTQSSKRSDATKLLNKRLGEVQAGKYRGPQAEKLTFEDLKGMLENHYHSMRSKPRAERALTHLKRHLGLYRVKNIAADVLTAYVAARREEKASESTIQYELAVLKKGMSLAIRAEKLDRRPPFPVLKVENTRIGFFEPEQFHAVKAELPEHHRAWAEFAFYTGWRVKSEVLTLQWSQVDFDAGVVRLEPGTTKTGRGRTFPFDIVPELKALLKHQREYTDKWQKARGEIVPWVFNRRGEQIKDFRAAWRSACKRAGHPERIPHDFRRTAVRQLERAGVSRSVAKELVGHRTDEIYERYAITSEQDLREGVGKVVSLSKRLQRKKAQQN